MKFEHVSLDVVYVLCFELALVALILVSLVVHETYVLLQVTITLGPGEQNHIHL